MNLIIKSFSELTSNELYEIMKSREEIFTIGQNIRVLDFDDVDYDAFHCFFMEGNRVVAYLRAFRSDGPEDTMRIGRVLTLKQGLGIGSDLMLKSMRAIKQRCACKTFVLDAQIQAVGFYERLGFAIVSDEFIEAGIPHVTMELKNFKYQKSECI